MATATQARRRTSAAARARLRLAFQTTIRTTMAPGSNNSAQLLALSRRYKDDPVGFFRDILGVTAWSKQEEIAEAIRDFKRVFVRSGHGTGKTFIFACIALWWLYAVRGDLVSTAPDKRGVQELLWAYIHKLRKNAIVPLPAVKQSLASLTTAFARGYGFTATKSNKGVGAQGKHDARLLVLIDEAYGVPPEFWLPLLSQASGDQNRIAAVGNPTDESSAAARHDKSGEWHRIRISCLEHPNITEGREVIEGGISPDFVRTVATTYGEGSGDYACRILGEYPDADPNVALVPRAATRKVIRPRDRDPVTAAIWAEIKAQHWTEPLVLGVDVARYGADATCIVHKRGGWVSKIELHRGKATTWVAQRIEDILKDHPEGIANVDDSNAGGGVVDILKQREVPHQAINFGASPNVITDAERAAYVNERARMLWGLRLRIMPHQGEPLISLPDCQEAEMLVDELQVTGWDTRPDGKKLIEPKTRVKAKLGRSPDVCDAVALAFYPTRLAWDMLVA